MKTSRKAEATDTISTHQMRFEFERVLRAVKAGRSLTLTYRSKPLARIVPLKEEQTLLWKTIRFSGWTNWLSQSAR